MSNNMFETMKESGHADKQLSTEFNNTAEHSTWTRMRQAWAESSRKEKAVIISIAATFPVSVPVIAGATYWLLKRGIPCGASGGY
ncbi:MAG: hypothetical protein VX740_09380 [Pseudomonadota bacterium]|nr:hypothetical protein [Pseudomonadota bacterium]MEC7702987.1 hypothetical protein [Pseudomonadota bacterium]MEC9235351.1 hypothetical protein [Pseudomonadota bacterium]MED5423634.1 hypothetical protein [Pseudomonadota bacterium]MEE3322425.1 hypothetical protein [Pseudomonadota bacterium]